ncbi:assimilatory sulfite reductase (NADPH) flavoprotein subunit [Halobacillus sp. BBL2006]|uniref:assimilatory sulfite reductase (NADPH) flavoprotein subunit n=1 Tax=Halobacillus sp. BBL2006 TaxID=1543706 RepID=UPI000543A6CA|nr:assimilatory sulfite reductase (NADPH) flavoprotein subunit [Halobacillus sp. BBL2006]KHE73002.1 sulfite reductase [NADPH] flavoprotein alpha-component [Halobacillus sp. BBL2006]
MQLEVMNSPFNQEQAELLNRLLSTLTDSQKMWLSGYLAAPQSGAPVKEQRTATEGASYIEAPDKTREITILYGSHTGNCQALAEEYSQKLIQNNYNVTVSSMDDFKPKSLKKVEDLLVLTSTHGDGDPPDNAITFYDFLHSKRAPKLDGMRFSVLSLGDSSYEFFCQTGKEIDKRLEELGGERIYERVDCDLDFEEPASQWFEGVQQKLNDQNSSVEPQTSTLDHSAVDLPVYSRANPYHAEILENINLNGRGSNKETRHVELDLEGAQLAYEPGDSLGIYPENDSVLVDQLIEEMNWNPEESVSINKQGDIRSLREALLSTYEITSLTKPLLQKAAKLTKDEALHKLIESEDQNELKEYIYGRDLLDLVRDYGPWHGEAHEFLGILRKIPVRLYSIASSIKANPEEVHLTIGALRYDAHGRGRTGVCSGQCAERSQPGDRLPVFVQKNSNFKLPENHEAPIIMIGAGTGVAPYRAFLEDREEEGAGGKSWLFFGEQHFVSDFLYQTEWQQWLEEGILTKMDVAFSRDTDEKVYVQHRLQENSKELFKWITEGAYIYVCGDEKHMAKDVQSTILQVLEQEGAMSKEEAEDYLNQLRKQKRYQRDVY